MPISLYKLGEQLHRVLRNYKDGPDDSSRERLRNIVAATLARFLSRHGSCIGQVGGEWSVLTTVPSTRQRVGPHPLEDAVQRVAFLRHAYERLLEVGNQPLDHQRASDDGFRVVSNVRDKRVLLVDDTFTAGARIQSAASALQLAGAHLAGAVVIGRVIDMGRPERQALWDESGAVPFSFDVCCLPTCAGRALPP